MTAPVSKVDFKKTLDSYRAKRGEFRTIEVPVVQYLQIDGHGDPNTSPEFVAAIEALYPVAYKLKFVSKIDLGRDYVVPPLEGLWWAENMDAFTAARDKSRWNWTLLLMVPDWIDHAMFAEAVDAVRAKGRPTGPTRLAGPAGLDHVRMEALHEGLCVQTLHVGTFDAEAEILHHLHHDVIPSRGLELRGKHHEIYLSDFRRTSAEKQRTILRQPVSAT